MKLTVCGGAGEVGASCYLVRIDGRNILLDSGIRMKGEDALPDFRRIQEAGGVDAILVSHAHLDHTGSLPVISREYPQARLYMTHATKSLVQVLLYDSLKIMERAEFEIPMYAESHVKMMLDNIVCYSPQYVFRLFPDSELTATFYSAGHIAGAAMVFLESPKGSLLYTGDYSVGSQSTINGASVPKLRPDVLLSESTYGEHLHANRTIEERRLVSTVAEVWERGGKVLIPAFALGRAQELILILKRAMAQGQLPQNPVFVDGMVRAVNGVYSMNPNYLKRSLARRLLRGDEVFYDEQVQPIDSPGSRQRVLDSTDPLCIISSSGMLKGGPSVLYARALAGDARSFIGLTGYQDEEAPGRDLLRLLDGEGGGELTLDGQTVSLQCGIGRYGLSAHADKGELIGLAERVGASRVFLVHGDPPSLDTLSRQMQESVRGEVVVPENGEEFDLAAAKGRRSKRRDVEFIGALGKDPKELTEETLVDLHRHVYARTGSAREYTAEELMSFWSDGSDWHDGGIQDLTKLLHKTGYFEPNPKRLYLYRPVPPEDFASKDGPMEMNAALAYAKQVLPDEAIHRVGAQMDKQIMVVSFFFPAPAMEQFGSELQDIGKTTGWTVEVHPECHLGAAETAAEDLFAETPALAKFSYFRDRDTVSVTLTEKARVGLAADPERLDAIVEAYRKKTGLKLSVANFGCKRRGRREQSGLQLRDLSGAPAMEQNQAFQYIEDVFQMENVKLYRKGRKAENGRPYILLTFITPQVGERYRQVIEGLEDDTGWNIVTAPNPNQAAVIECARRVVSERGFSIRRGPGIHADKALAEIELADEVDESTASALRKRFAAMTGYDLALRTFSI